MSKTNEVMEVYDKNSLLVTDNEIFNVKLLNPKCKEFERGVAYLSGDYYYPFRGILSKCDSFNAKPWPGIYLEEDTEKTIIVHPKSEEEKAQYTYAGRISNIDPEPIINQINKSDNILIAMPESSKIFMPTPSKDDDILKRSIKRALLEKGIDIDQYRERFLDKNALFNFKQVIKGNSTLSMLLFNRGCEALDLKYTIIIEEDGSNNIIGNPLKEKIIVSSEDTYEIQ